ncbi:hypothetical protein BJY59DRAFT_151868 [Rhodotorula toruloides]
MATVRERTKRRRTIRLTGLRRCSRGGRHLAEQLCLETSSFRLRPAASICQSRVQLHPRRAKLLLDQQCEVVTDRWAATPATAAPKSTRPALLARRACGPSVGRAVSLPSSTRRRPAKSRQRSGSRATRAAWPGLASISEAQDHLHHVAGRCPVASSRRPRLPHQHRLSASRPHRFLAARLSPSSQRLVLSNPARPRQADSHVPPLLQAGPSSRSRCRFPPRLRLPSRSSCRRCPSRCAAHSSSVSQRRSRASR